MNKNTDKKKKKRQEAQYRKSGVFIKEETFLTKQEIDKFPLS